ncbi:MAG: hypothetical protein MI919_28760, partial [Holophagales bacterium]|nr:hypothetical protein [Holophagales bacterium]
MQSRRQEARWPVGVDPSVFPEWHRIDEFVSLGSSELDRLPFGAIKLDDQGRILLYNTWEAKISGRRPAE